MTWSIGGQGGYFIKTYRGLPEALSGAGPKARHRQPAVALICLE
jgi:hypothetical protein